MRKRLLSVFTALFLLFWVLPSFATDPPFTSINLTSSQANPYAGFTKGTDGNYYGTTYEGGTNGQGSIIKLTPNGTLTTIYSFATGNTGNHPLGSIIQESNGHLYGTTLYGGTDDRGVVFRFIESGSVYTVLHHFTGGSDGGDPYSGLVLDNGILYGTASSGGDNSGGVFFKIVLNGPTFSVVQPFPDNDSGRFPVNITLGSDGNIYVSNYSGSTYNGGAIWKYDIDQTSSSNLHSFSYSTDGFHPVGVSLASNGKLYGTTYLGGTNDVGTFFCLNPSNSDFDVLRHFAYSTDGGYTSGFPMQATDGNIYGVNPNGNPTYGII